MLPDLIETLQRFGHIPEQSPAIALDVSASLPRTDDELLRIYRDPNARLSLLSTEELIRLEYLIHPDRAGRLGKPGATTAPLVPNPERPWPGRDPDPRGGTMWFRTQEDAVDFERSRQSQRDDAALLRLFYDRSQNLGMLTVSELLRLKALTDPVRAPGPAPLVAPRPPNPERPYLARDPDPRIEHLWFERPEDVEWYFRSIGIDPQQLRGVYRGIPQPLPGAWTLPPWPK